MNKNIVPVLISIFLIASGCYPSTQGEISKNTEVINTEETAQEIKNYQNNQSQKTIPQRILVIEDMTDSLEKYRIKRLTNGELKPLIELIARNGGELAILKVCDDSNTPLLRLRVKKPPSLDSTNLINPIPPQSKNLNANPFQAQEELERIQKAQIIYQKQSRWH